MEFLQTIGGIGLHIWGFFIVISILFLLFTEWEWGGSLTVLTIISLIFLQLVFAVPIYQYISENPWRLLLLIIGYFGVGIVWAVCKWYLYLVNQRDKYYELKQEFITNNKLTIGIKDSIPSTALGNWWGFTRLSNFKEVPQIRDHKTSIYIWITYWPYSMLWTLINDPVRKVVIWLYNRISGTLQSISNHVWRNVVRDFEGAEEESSNE